MSGCFFCCKTKCKKIKTNNRTDRTLSALRVGESAKILHYLDGLDFGLKRRLLELGFVCGEIVRVNNISILGDVMLFEINGYMISLRKNIVKFIECEKV